MSHLADATAAEIADAILVSETVNQLVSMNYNDDNQTDINDVVLAANVATSLRTRSSTTQTSNKNTFSTITT